LNEFTGKKNHEKEENPAHFFQGTTFFDRPENSDTKNRTL
jgi:hypothetical protein